MIDRLSLLDYLSDPIIKWVFFVAQIAYGMTETNLTHVQSIHSHLQKPGSCGAVTSDTMSKVFFIRRVSIY